MATIVYLDADDEITSAAMRIRQAGDTRVALVIPFGSRVATSRINFKLLAREAMANGRRLDIVAPDASARALAASAGLPVFGSVAEYEDALDLPPADDDAPTTAARDLRATGKDAAPGLAAGAAGAAGAGSGRGAATPGSAGADRPARGAGGAGTGRGTAPAAEDPRASAAREAELDAAIHRGREVPVAKPRRRGPGAGVVAGLLLLVLALVVAGVAAFLFLPSAEIAITPRIETIGPIELVVTADPAATAVDEAARVIPAQSVEVPVEVSDEFPATGKRVARTPATGGVKWRNCDNSAAYTIPSGTIVRTSGGIEFSIDEAVFLPVAVISGSGANVQLQCQTSQVGVTAVKSGPDGNVAPGAIDVVPARYNRNLISVFNPAATAGGTREEFTRVSQDDIDAALAKLTGDLRAQFETQLGDPSGVPAGVPDGATIFPETAVLGDGTPSADPASLVDQEVESFQLGMTATGTVLAVDASPVETIARTALKDAVSAGYQLVDGSTRVTVGEGSVDGSIVEFRVAGIAKQVRPVDGEALRRQVLGRSAADARALLAPYGEVKLVLWPDMVTTVPTLEQRVTLVVRPAVDPSPDSSAPAPSTPAPTESPVDASGGAVPSEPIPSG